MVFGLSKCLSFVVFASPLNAVGICVATHLHSLFPWRVIPGWWPMLLVYKRSSVGCLLGSIECAESRTVCSVVKRLTPQRGKAFLSRINSKAVYSVRVVKESLFGRVYLHVAPSATLPTARHQVQALVYVQLRVNWFVVMLVKLRWLDFFHIGYALMGCLFRIEGRPLHVSFVNWGCILSIKCFLLGVQNLICIHTNSIEATWATTHHFHLARDTIRRS